MKGEIQKRFKFSWNLVAKSSVFLIILEVPIICLELFILFNNIQYGIHMAIPTLMKSLLTVIGSVYIVRKSYSKGVKSQFLNAKATIEKTFFLESALNVVGMILMTYFTYIGLRMTDFSGLFFVLTIPYFGILILEEILIVGRYICIRRIIYGQKDSPLKKAKAYPFLLGGLLAGGAGSALLTTISGFYGGVYYYSVAIGYSISPVVLMIALVPTGRVYFGNRKDWLKDLTAIQICAGIFIFGILYNLAYLHSVAFKLEISEVVICILLLSLSPVIFLPVINLFEDEKLK